MAVNVTYQVCHLYTMDNKDAENSKHAHFHTADFGLK